VFKKLSLVFKKDEIVGMEEYSLVVRATEYNARLIRILTFVTYSIVLIALIVVVVMLSENGVEGSILVKLVAAIFVIMTLPLSAHDINNHLLHFEQPLLQVYVIRILFMIPLYSVTSLISLNNENLNVYLECVRGLYEAFVIWNFTYFLMVYLAPTEESLANHLQLKPQSHHLFPMNYLVDPWPMGPIFLFNCKFGTLQYVIWKIFVVVVTFILEIFGVFGYGEWGLTSAYFYVTGITNLSQIVALYCLILFYHATMDDLAPIRPLPKFICIKAVVFFSFWQQCLISVLVYIGVIHGSKYFSTSVVAEALEDFVICIEMFLFAIAHHYFFSYKDFTYRFSSHYLSSPLNNRRRQNSSRGRALLEAAHPRDLVHDISRDLRRFSIDSWRGNADSRSAAISLLDNELILVTNDLDEDEKIIL